MGAFFIALNKAFKLFALNKNCPEARHLKGILSVVTPHIKTQTKKGN